MEVIYIAGQEISTVDKGRGYVTSGLSCNIV